MFEESCRAGIHLLEFMFAKISGVHKVEGRKSKGFDPPAFKGLILIFILHTHVRFEDSKVVSKEESNSK